MNDYKFACEKYRKKLIELINPKLSGLKVLNDNYLLLNIFSYFKSGWFVNKNKFHNKTCIYKDIFGKFVEIHQVTERIQNPYRDKGVCKKISYNSHYVGPIISWYKTNHNRRIFKHK